MPVLQEGALEMAGGSEYRSGGRREEPLPLVVAFIVVVLLVLLYS